MILLMLSSLSVSAHMLACHCLNALVLCHPALRPHIARHACCIHADCAPHHFMQQHSIERKEKTTSFGVNIMRSPALYRAAQVAWHSTYLLCCQTADNGHCLQCHMRRSVVYPNVKAPSLLAAVSQARCVCSILSSQTAPTDWQQHAGPMRNWKLFQDFRLILVQTCKIPFLTPALMAAIRLSLVT